VLTEISMLFIINLLKERLLEVIFISGNVAWYLRIDKWDMVWRPRVVSAGSESYSVIACSEH